MKVYENLLKAAEEAPDQICYEFMGAQFPYSMAAAEARALAAGLLKLGVRPGDSIGCMLPNIPPFVAVHYGTLMAGCVFVPMNVMLLGPEIEYLVRDSKIKVIVTYEMFAQNVADGLARMEHPPKVFVVGANTGSYHAYHELLDYDARFEPVDVADDQPIQTLYTSGTTGKPKGAQITNGNVVANMKMFESILPSEPGDKALCVLPMFHVFALNGVLNASVWQRSSVVMQPKFDVESCIRSLSEDGITSFAGVPTMYFYMLKHPLMSELKFPRLRHCVSGGAAMPVEVMNQWEQVTGVPIFEGFGLTETTVSICINRPGKRKVGSIGLPFDGVEMKIVDENDQDLPDTEVGEVVVRAPNVMAGYLNRPDETAECMRGGYFHTGDLGYRDAEGFFYIVDRKKDMIIKGGYNIYPREIEEVLYQIPEIAEAAVIGVFDEVKGEHVRAVVAFKPGKSITPESIEAYLEQRLAKYKLPQEYTIVPELPKGPTGKILKRELRAQHESWNRDRAAKIQQGAAS